MLAKKKIIASLAGNATETVLGFVVIMFATRSFAQADVGVYFIVLAIVSILNNLKEGFLQNGLVKYLVEKNFDATIYKTGFFISHIAEVAKIVAFTCIAFYYRPIEGFLVFYGLYSLTFSNYRLLVFMHKSKLEMKEILKGNLIILASSLIGLVLLYYLQLSIEWILLVIAIANVLAIVGVKSNRNLIQAYFISKYDANILKQISFFGKFGILKEVAGSIAHQAGVFISAYYLTLEATAILGLATRYTILISIPAASLAGLLYPTMLKNAGDRTLLIEVAKRGIGKMYAILIPMAVITVLASPVVIRLLHGHQYMDATFILALKIIASVFLIPLGSGFSSLMNAINKPQQITHLMFVSSLSNISIMLMLAYFFGLWGIAIAPLLAEVIGAFYIKRKLHLYLRFDPVEIAEVVLTYWREWLKKTSKLPWKKLKYQ
ncbi:MAG: polysaccharide biosynthesis C-terminal domain-containing protein [Ekhidna sp.]|nr:polysaccharide biosynthesis C-terminal domain-containing protein [Ekhidna sp.]